MPPTLTRDNGRITTLEYLIGLARAGSGGSGSIKPLARTAFIDGLTTTAPASATGSIAAPYLTPEAWLTALLPAASAADAETVASAVVSPAPIAAYSGQALVIPPYRNLELRSLIEPVEEGVAGNVLTSPVITWDNASASAPAPANAFAHVPQHVQRHGWYGVESAHVHRYGATVVRARAGIGAGARRVLDHIDRYAARRRVVPGAVRRRPDVHVPECVPPRRGQLVLRDGHRLFVVCRCDCERLAYQPHLLQRRSNGNPRTLIELATYRSFQAANGPPPPGFGLDRAHFDPQYSGWQNASRPRDMAIFVRPPHWHLA
jgi:hypothetical protein